MKSGQDTVHNFKMKSQQPDKRLFQRYPCVGISLTYAALTDQNVDNIYEYINKATSNDFSVSGLSFDTHQQLDPGDKIIVLITIPEQNLSERLLAEVSWCKKISDEKFRIGVKINTSEIISKKIPEDHTSKPVNSDSVPAEIELRCPACMINSTFVFIDHQSVPGKGNIPLYNCSNCGSTRSLMGVLASNRHSTNS